MRGVRVLDWTTGSMADAELGRATLLAGSYTAANVILGRATQDEVGPQDPLLGHTAVFSGVARRAGQTTPFEIVVDYDC